MPVLSSRSRFGLLLSAFLALLGVTILIGVYSTLQYRDFLANERGLTWSDSENARLMYSFDNVFFEDELVHVVYLEPLDEQAPIPPGLDSWPTPGTVAISSALADKKEYVERQFGEIAGYIDDSVLLNEREAIVFVRPETAVNWEESAREETGIYFASGFGQGDSAPYGFVNYEEWSNLLLPLLALTLIPTILIFVITARRYAQVSVRSAQHSLIVIGASKRVLRRYLFRAFAPWLAIGAFCALLLQLFFMFHGVTIPVTSFDLRPEMLRSSVPLILLADVLVFAILTFFFTTPHTRTVFKNSKGKEKEKTIGLVLFVLGIVCASVVGIMGIRLPDKVYIALIFVAVLGVCFGIPATFTVLFRILTRVYLRQHFLSLSTPFMRWIDNNARRAARNASLTGVIIVLGAFLITNYANLISITNFNVSEAPKNSYATEMRFTCRGISPCGQTALEAVVEKAPDATHVAVIATDQGGSYGLTYIPDGETDKVAVREFIKEREMENGVNGDVPSANVEEAHGFIYSLSDTPIVDTLQTVRFGDFIPLTGNIEDANRNMIAIYTQHAQWFILTAYVTFLIALLISLSSSTQKISEEAKEFASLAALTGKRKKISRHLIARSAWLTVWGLVAGVFVGGFIALQIAPTMFLGMLGRFIAVTVFIFVLAELFEGVVYYREIKHWAKQWKPGQGTGAL